MIKTFEDLRAAIKETKLTEVTSNNIELKSSWDKRHGDKISALANKSENEISWLVIGVDDEGNILNREQEWAKQIEEIISQQINEYLDPYQACSQISCEQINGAWIVIVAIINPGAVVRWDGEAYKKSGTTILKMQPDEVMSLSISLPGMLDYSGQASDKNIQGPLLDRFIDLLFKRDPDIASFKNMPDRVLDYVNIRNRKVSEILFGVYSYRVIFYDSSGAIKLNESRKGLFGLLIDEFCNEIQQWPISQGCVTGNSFPAKALKEALANAVAHSAYFNNQGEVVVEIYCDKICISNLCFPESEAFANKWFSRGRYSFNRLLMESLRLIGAVDELGHGKRRIYSDSIRCGKKQPFVVIENAGRHRRWKITIYGESMNKILQKLFKRLIGQYEDEDQALIAFSVILWRHMRVSEIKKYIDSSSVDIFIKVISDINGPFIFVEKDDSIYLKRWVAVLIEEGKDSKKFKTEEENWLYRFAYNIQTKYHEGRISPKELRKLGGMQDTKSEIVLSANLLKKWEQEGKVKKKKQGEYQFIEKVPEDIEKLSQIRLKDLLTE